MNTEWILLEKKSPEDRFVAQMVVHDIARYPVTIILVCEGKDSYFTIPFKDYSFLKPCEISFEEARSYVMNTPEVWILSKNQFEKKKLAYACMKFEENVHHQLDEIMNKCKDKSTS